MDVPLTNLHIRGSEILEIEDATKLGYNSSKTFFSVNFEQVFHWLTYFLCQL